MHNDFDNLACRVCGQIQGDPPWGENGKCSSHNICECCGVEFGYEDCTVKSTKIFREIWLSNGAKWWLPKEKPANWSLEEQIKNIPKNYR
jgi:hypothetical protein